MDHTNIILAVNIQKYRKRAGLTQEELAEKLDVTFQAVSKWENAKSAPDILFLPTMANLFGCSIDELFSREVSGKETQERLYSQFPGGDDQVIRGVVCEGRKILQVTDAITEKFTFEIIGDAKNVQSECNITVCGDISEGCQAGGSITVDGGGVSGGCTAGGSISVGEGVSGGCNAGNSITTQEGISGGCNAGNNIFVEGGVSGGCACGSNITCNGSISGNVECGGTIHVAGDVEAHVIKGNVTCHSLDCETVKGDVVCNTLECDKIEGDVTVKQGN